VAADRETVPVAALFEIDVAGGRASRTYAALLRPIVGDVEEAFPWAALDAAEYDPGLIERARLGWTENAFNEFCTATAMGQLVELMGQANVPIDLWAIAASFPLEELLHVELCSRVAMRLGGGAPIVYDPADLTLPFEPHLSRLQRVTEMVVRLCCVGEVFSLPMLAGSMQAATNSLTKAVLTQIVKDEAMHGKLGWMFLDWIGPRLEDSERARLSAAAADTAAGLRRVWARLRVRPEAVPERGASDMGWMESGAYVERARRVLAEDVCSRLAGYGIMVPPLLE
jgi:hypothetical protein